MPLSEQEQRILDEIESKLRDHDSPKEQPKKMSIFTDVLNSLDKDKQKLVTNLIIDAKDAVMQLAIPAATIVKAVKTFTDAAIDDLEEYRKKVNGDEGASRDDKEDDRSSGPQGPDPFSYRRNRHTGNSSGLGQD